MIDHLVRLGVERDRLVAVSFGKERPLSRSNDAAGLAQNRRAEFRLLRGDVELVVEPGTAYDDRGQVIAAAAN